MDQNELRELLKAGIDAAKDNNKIIARDYLRQVLEEDPNNELAWLWMAHASETVNDRRRCLLRVLEINPNNDNARTALERLQGGTTPQSGAPMSGTMRPQVQRRGATQTSENRPHRPTEERRDWFQPVQRGERPGELWGGATRRPRNENWLAMLILAAVGIGLIGLAVFLLLDQLNEDDNGQATVDAVSASQTAAMIAQTTLLPPTITNTPRPTNNPSLVPFDTRLPPTFPPTLTATARPSPTRTPAPNPPESYRLVFSANVGPSDPYELFTVVGDGTALNSLPVTLPTLQLVPNVAATEEVVTTDVSPTEEGAEPPTEVPQEAPASSVPELLDPAYSPDGEFIVFTGQFGDIQELFIVPASGGQARQLTQLGAPQTRDAVWSLDGQQILFASNSDGDFDLYMMAANGNSAPTKLLENDSDDRQPAWSPDGRFYAFSSDLDAPGNFEIFVAAMQGEGLCQMTDARDSSFSPSWSPNGLQIAFISNRNRDNDLYIMQADGSDERVITVDGDQWEDRDPAWSPDGQWIVLSTTRVNPESGLGANPTSKLWLVTPNGAEWRQVTSSEGNDLSASWLPLPGNTPTVTVDFQCAAR